VVSKRSSRTGFRAIGLRGPTGLYRLSGVLCRSGSEAGVYPRQLGTLNEGNRGGGTRNSKVQFPASLVSGTATIRLTE